MIIGPIRISAANACALPVVTGGQPLLEAGKIDGGMDAFFAELPDQLQKKTLGKGRYELWKDGKIKLSDLADSQGNQRTIKELK